MLAGTARRVGFLGLLVPRGFVDYIALIVTIVVPNPAHGVGQAILVAPLGRHVQKIVNAEHNVEAAGVGGIGMEDGAGRVFRKHARSRSFIRWKFGSLVVVINLATGFFSRRERNVIIVVEIAAERGYPLEFPAHAFLKRFDLGDRRVRNRDQRGVAIRQ